MDEITSKNNDKAMFIYNDYYSWEGWGGKLRLAHGKCRLRICDLTKGKNQHINHLRSMIIIVSDIPQSKMSVKSCAGHIATNVVKDFNIKPHRMLWIEYYAMVEYGSKSKKVIPEKFEVVEFTWRNQKAIQPKWRLLTPPMLDAIKELIFTS